MILPPFVSPARRLARQAAVALAAAAAALFITPTLSRQPHR